MDLEWFSSIEICQHCGHSKKRHEGIGSAGHCHDCEKGMFEKMGIALGGRYHTFVGNKGQESPPSHDTPICDLPGELYTAI